MYFFRKLQSLHNIVILVQTSQKYLIFGHYIIHLRNFLLKIKRVGISHLEQFSIVITVWVFHTSIFREGIVLISAIVSIIDILKTFKFVEHYTQTKKINSFGGYIIEKYKYGYFSTLNYMYCIYLCIILMRGVLFFRLFF